MKKKLIAVILSLLLAIIMLVACNKEMTIVEFRDVLKASSNWSITHTTFSGGSFLMERDGDLVYIITLCRQDRWTNITYWIPSTDQLFFTAFEHHNQQPQYAEWVEFIGYEWMQRSFDDYFLTVINNIIDTLIIGYGPSPMLYIEESNYSIVGNVLTFLISQRGTPFVYTGTFTIYGATITLPPYIS